MGTSGNCVLTRSAMFAWLLGAALSMTEACAQTVDMGGKCPRVFDSLIQTSKPDLKHLGMEIINLSGTAYWYKDRTAETMKGLPEKSRVQEWVRTRPDQKALLVIDLEHWAIQGTLAEKQAVVDQFVTLIRWIKETGYQGPVGYYAVVPYRDYWRATGTPEKYAAWVADNNFVQPIADAVDVLLPSLYTFYDHVPGWRRYAVENLREARRMAKGKPVYAFLWPYFHNSNAVLVGQPIPGDMWATELTTVSQNADGFVLWNGGGAWSTTIAQHDFWKVTEAFLAQRATRCRKPSTPTNPRAE